MAKIRSVKKSAIVEPRKTSTGGSTRRNLPVKQSHILSGQKNSSGRVKKKTKVKNKKIQLQQTITTTKKVAEEEKARKIREKAVIVHDLNPMLEALLATEYVVSKNKKEVLLQTKKGQRNKKQEQKKIMEDFSLLMNIQNDEKYKQDPFSILKTVQHQVQNGLM